MALDSIDDTKPTFSPDMHLQIKNIPHQLWKTLPTASTMYKEGLEKALILVRKMHMCTFSFRILYQTGFFLYWNRWLEQVVLSLELPAWYFFMEMMLEAVSKEWLTWEEAEFLQTSLGLVEKGSSWFQEEGYLKGHVWEKKYLRVALHVVVTLKTANCRSSIYFYVEMVKK